MSLPLNQHILLEASAGTGKTYSIVQYVVAALESGISLDEILLVTFTEKAAGELRVRVRRGIEERLSNSPKKQALKEAIESFDRAQIFTIHGFCQRVLRQNPLAGSVAKARMIDNADITETCLREFQRREWPRRYSTDLLPVLEMSRWCDEKKGAALWEAVASQVLARFNPEFNHALRPQVPPGETLASLETRLNETLQEFMTGVEDAEREAREHPVVRQYAALKMTPQTRDSIIKRILIPVVELAYQRWAAPDLLNQFEALVLDASESAPYKKLKGFEAPFLAAKDALGVKIEALEKLGRELNQLRDDLNRFQFRLSAETVTGVLQRMHAYKQERGLQSYDDLLSTVHKAVSSTDAPDVIESLRGQYRVAIVDEFQDTDPVQWEIFRQVFFQAGDNKHALVAVGDPKQAIYAFRSADVDTYLRAREFFRNNGTVLPLTTCYRISVAMKNALNTFFGGGGLLTRPDIGYTQVSTAKAADCPRLDRDDSGRSALSIIRFGSEVSGGRARCEMAQFIAAECARLLKKPAIHFTRRETSRDITAGDIAILFFRRAEAAPIEDALRAMKVPYTFYKKSQMWSSDEAVHMWYALSALAEPEDSAAWRKMLLTRFFGVLPQETRALDEIGTDHPFMALVQRWRELCSRMDWAELFRSMLEDTGLLPAEAREFDGARRVANWRFIAHTLAQDAYANGLDISEVRELLRSKRNLPDFDESNLHPLESERPAVKLMTIFASKGLEFPIVFLAGGYTPKKKDPYAKYHQNEQVVFDLASDPAAQQLSRQEEAYEQERLIYVAMTRAMFKLYVPAQGGQPSPDFQGKARDERWGGALAHVCRCIQRMPACPDVSIRDAGGVLQEPAEPLPPADAKSQRNAALPVPLLLESELAGVAGRRLRTHSYTGLVHARKAPKLRMDDQERPDRDDDEQVPDEQKRTSRSEDALPQGPKSGEAMHLILEELDWTAVKNAPTPEDLLDDAPARDLIEGVLKRHLPKVKERELLTARAAELVHNVLRAPLKALDGSTLCDIPATERSHEIEFHLPWAADIFSAVPEDLAADGGFLTGVIDLVMRAGGKYYMLDWKSNTLPAYTPAEVKRDVFARRYDLQYRIYLQALQKWLGPHGVGPASFGGVIYAYLRGVRQGDGESGIYFHQPLPFEWEMSKLLSDLRAQAGAARAEASQA
ncbi:MAG TPA: UvrD-helicase domain-containing protein [Planctomycetota bacterium]|nr:UvrD-helicase domain-containing protein [Planctomycetota bacterium]